MNTIRLFALFFLTGSILDAENFQLKDGSSLEGELLGLYNGIVYVASGSKQTSFFPYSVLAEESQPLVEEWFDDYVKSLDKEPRLVEEVDGKLAGFLSRSLVKFDGEDFVDFDFSKESEPEFYAFYYSARWCGPCRRFTPKLVAFYNLMKRQGHNFELVFVSSDESPKEMKKYMADYKMAWPAVKYGKRGNTLVSRYKGNGIPCLVVTDREGRVLFHSYQGSEYLGPSSPMDRLSKALLQKTLVRGELKKQEDSSKEQAAEKSAG